MLYYRLKQSDYFPHARSSNLSHFSSQWSHYIGLVCVFVNRHVCRWVHSYLCIYSDINAILNMYLLKWSLVRASVYISPSCWRNTSRPFQRNLVVPPALTSTVQQRNFAVVNPSSWNRLPNNLQNELLSFLVFASAWRPFFRSWFHCVRSEVPLISLSLSGAI